MPIERNANLEVIVNDLIKDVQSHANQIASIQTDLNRMSSDLSSVRDLLIKNTERSDLLITHIKGQSDEMLKLLTDGERARNDRSNFNNKQAWAVAAALATGIGSALITVLKLIFG